MSRKAIVVFALLVIGFVGFLVAPDDLPAVTLDGSRDTLARIDVNVHALIDRARVHSAWRSDANLEAIQMLGVTHAVVYLQLHAGSVEPLIELADPHGQVAEALIYAGYAEPDGSDYCPMWERWFSSGALNGSLDHYRLRYVGERLMCGPVELLNLLEAGQLDLEAAMVSELAQRVSHRRNLGSVAVMIPESDKLRWGDLTAEAGELAVGHPASQFVVGVISTLASELRQALAGTVGLAAGFHLDEEGVRQLSYAHYFSSEELALSATGQLRSGAVQSHGFVGGIARALQEPGIFLHVRRAGRLISMQLNWVPSVDERVALAVTEATVGHALGGLAVAIEPSDEPIVPQWEAQPRLASTLATGDVQHQVLSELGRRCFPAWYFDSGDAPHMIVEVDPLIMANASLAVARYETIAVHTAAGEDVLRSESGTHLIDLAGPAAGHMRIPTTHGVTAAALASARVRFDIDWPIATEMFTFAARDSVGAGRHRAGIQVSLKQLDRDVATIEYQGPTHNVTMIARDSAGRVLQRSMWMCGGGTATARFAGIIDHLDVVFSRETTNVSGHVDIDLNGGEPLELPEAPAAGVPQRIDRTVLDEFADLSSADLKSLSVRWSSDASTPWSHGLAIDLPISIPDPRCRWELHWFDGVAPMVVPGSAMSIPQRLIWKPDNKDILPQVAAVCGRVGLELPTSIRVARIERSAEGLWITASPAGDTAVSARFDLNAVTIRHDGQRIVEVAAFDASGERLKAEIRRTPMEQGEQYYFWGQPQEVHIVAASDLVAHTLPFEIQTRSFDPEKFKQVKAMIADHRRAGIALHTIDKALRANWTGYADDAAGLFYLHGKNGLPGHHIPLELARACPQGAGRFNYEVVPFAGYHIEVLNDIEGRRSAHPQSFVWDGGTVETPTHYQRPHLVAHPLNPTYPTLYFAWGSLYAKHLGGVRLDSPVASHWNAGWVPVEIVH
jgi:hypothetical protein